MQKIKFIAHHLFAPIFLFLMINCFTLTIAIKRVSGFNEFNNQPAILCIFTIIVTCIGIAAFFYYMYQKIKEKIILINVARDRLSFLSSYVAASTGFFYLLMNHNDIMPFVTILFTNLTNIFVLLYLHEITKNYKEEFSDQFKLVFMDSKNIKWFLLFSKRMFNLKIKFNEKGVLLNNNYIKKENIPYYEEMFDKKITELDNEELKLIEMYEI